MIDSSQVYNKAGGIQMTKTACATVRIRDSETDFEGVMRRGQSQVLIDLLEAL